MNLKQKGLRLISYQGVNIRGNVSNESKFKLLGLDWKQERDDFEKDCHIVGKVRPWNKNCNEYVVYSDGNLYLVNAKKIRFTVHAWPVNKKYEKGDAGYFLIDNKDDTPSLMYPDKWFDEKTMPGKTPKEWLEAAEAEAERLNNEN